MTSTAQPSTPSQTVTAGRRVEQARYQIPDGTRGLYAQRIDGRVALVDVPMWSEPPHDAGVGVINLARPAHRAFAQTCLAP